MIRITFSMWTDERGRRYSVSQDGTPMMPDTSDMSQALKVMAAQLARLETSRVPSYFELWDGDKGESFEFSESRLA